MIDLHKIPASELLAALRHHPDFEDRSPEALAARVISTAVSVFSISEGELLGCFRPDRISHPRMAAMSALREMGLSLVDTGQAFGGRDHGAVIHAIKRIPRLCAKDPTFADLVRRFREALALPSDPPAQISQTYVQRRLSLPNLSNQPPR